MLKLGAVKKTSERINFRDWLKNYYNQGKRYEFTITRIFLPNRFPNLTLILMDEENQLEISRTVKPEIGKELIKEFKLSTKKSTPGKLVFVITEKGETEIHKTEEDIFEYEPDTWGWRLISKSQKEEETDEDIPF